MAIYFQIATDMKLQDILDAILKENWSAVPPTDYRKQVRIQIKNAILTNANFAHDFHCALCDAFGSIPDLDEVDEWIGDMSGYLAEICKRYGVLGKAEQQSNESRAE